MGKRILVLGHNHPTVALEDSLGNVTKEPCWVKCRVNKEMEGKKYLQLPDEVIMVPAFNKVLGGSPVNLGKGKLLGPLFSEGYIDIGSSEIYLPDGIFLGKVSDLMINRESIRVRTTPVRDFDG